METEKEFQRELMVRLPLAEATLKLFDHVFQERFLEEVFQADRQRCYQKKLSFSSLVWLIRDALTVDHGSGHQSMCRAERNGELSVRMQNIYGKLGRVPVELSMELLEQGTTRLEKLMPEEGTEQPGLPECLGQFEVIVVDGKKVKNVSKRLKVLRGQPGKILGGKLLVALSVRKHLAIAMQADPDGERNDVPLTPGLVNRIRGMESRPILWVVDRQFCDLGLPALFCERTDHFLVRHGMRLKFHPDPEAGAREGTDASGRRYVEEWGTIGGPTDKRRRYVRRIVLHRENGEDLALLTDLLDADQYPATDLLATYLERWGIEKVFQQLTEVFELRTLIGSTPQATIFQGAMCLLLYNLIQVVRAIVAQAGAKQFEQVSTEKLFDDVHREMTAWAKLGDPSQTIHLLPQTQDPGELRAWLRGRLKWTDSWLKSPSKKKHAHKHVPTAPGHGGHTSAWRLIMASRGRST